MVRISQKLCALQALILSVWVIDSKVIYPLVISSLEHALRIELTIALFKFAIDAISPVCYRGATFERLGGVWIP
jgi:hypothetical protein